MRKDTILNKFPGRSFLFTARSKNGPDALRPLASPLGSGALSDLAVNDHRANGLLGQIVGGSNRRINEESKIRTPVFVQSVGDSLGLPGQLLFRNQGPQVSLNNGDRSSVLFLRHGLAQMPEVEEPLELTQQSNSELLIGLIGKRGQEFDVANQVSQTELLKRAGVFDVGGEEVANQGALEGFPQDFLQDLGTAGSLHGEKAKKPGAKGPDPIAIAVILMARLINMKTGLVGQGPLKLLIRDFERGTDGFDLIGESRAGDWDFKDFLHEFFQGGVGAVKGSFHIDDQALEPGAEDISFSNTFRQRGVQLLLTLRTKGNPSGGVR